MEAVFDLLWRWFDSSNDNFFLSVSFAVAIFFIVKELISSGKNYYGNCEKTINLEKNLIHNK